MKNTKNVKKIEKVDKSDIFEMGLQKQKDIIQFCDGDFEEREEAKKWSQSKIYEEGIEYLNEEYGKKGWIF